jgi:hypothetical protein
VGEPAQSPGGRVGHKDLAVQAPGAQSAPHRGTCGNGDEAAAVMDITYEPIKFPCPDGIQQADATEIQQDGCLTDSRCQVGSQGDTGHGIEVTLDMKHRCSLVRRPPSPDNPTPTSLWDRHR